jgi:T5SS/PEP-CTERM-associated repeat protein
MNHARWLVVAMGMLVLSAGHHAAGQCALTSQEFSDVARDLIQERIQDVRDAGLPCRVSGVASCFGEYRGTLLGGRSDEVRVTADTDSRGFIRVTISIGAETVQANFINASDYRATFFDAGICVQARFFKGPCTMIGTWASTEQSGVEGLWFSECFTCCDEEPEPEEEPDECLIASAITQATWIGAGGGLFHDNSRWSTGEPPGTTGIALFNEQLVGLETLEFTSDVTNDSLVVANDAVGLDLQGRTYTLAETSGCFTSLIVGGPADPDILTGSLVVLDGTVDARAIRIGDFEEESGAIEVQGATLNASKDCVVGRFGNGVLRLLDGGIFEGADLILAQEPDTTGAVNVLDGGRMAIDNLVMGASPTADGTVIVEGERGINSSVLIVRGRTEIGVTGEATMTIRDGGLVTSGSESGSSDDSISIIAEGATSVAFVSVEGPGDSQWQTQFLEIGRNGDADLIIKDGARVFSTSSVIGTGSQGSGGVTVTGGGSWDVETLLVVGVGGVANVDIDAQSRVTVGQLLVGPNGQVDTPRVTVRGGSPTQKRITRNLQAVPDVGIVTAELVIEEGGQLDADDLSLEPGGEVAGAGNLGGSLRNTGTMSPGPDDCTTGTLTMTGDYVQAGSGTLRIKLRGSQSSSGHDVLDVGGTATLAGTLHVEAVDNFSILRGDSFEILTAGRIEGQFDSIVGSGEFDVSVEADRVVLTVVTPPSVVSPSCTGDAADDRNQPEQSEDQPAPQGQGSESNDDTAPDDRDSQGGSAGPSPGGGPRAPLCGAGIAPTLTLTGLGLAFTRRRRACRIVVRAAR